jgi:hypothetical protein
MTRAFELTAIVLALSLVGCGPSDPSEGRDSPGVLTAGQTLDPSAVPERLRPLVPLAARWGIGDDVERWEHIERSSPADREALAAALAPYQAEITAWLDSFEPGAMSDEAAAFMYTQVALEEMR